MCNLQRISSIDGFYLVSVHLVEGFQKRRLKCEKLTTTDDRRKSDGKSSQKNDTPVYRHRLHHSLIHLVL